MALSRDEIIEKIRDVALQLAQEYLSWKQFHEHSGIHIKQLRKHFALWNDAVLAAGLQPLDRRGFPSKTKGYSVDELIEKAKEIARKNHHQYLSLTEFKQQSGISARPVYRHFGDWISFLAAAGLKPHPNQNQKISDESLFEDYFRVYKQIGHLPLNRELAQYAHYSIGTFETRFGTFSKFSRNAVMLGINQGILPPDVVVPEPVLDSPLDVTSSSIYNELNDRPVLGEAIEYRGLHHAPVNEMGVVFLFGMMAEELGFAVESVQAGFPDCEAKRKLKKDRWQRVRIEFEYRSSNFLQHKHDISGCDLIVCWEHDWRNSPLEVICLKDCIHKTNNLPRGTRQKTVALLSLSLIAIQQYLILTH